jgi:hypothetical protein
MAVMCADKTSLDEVFRNYVHYIKAKSKTYAVVVLQQQQQ